MKYRRMILCLALALLLSGCGIIPDDYVHVESHKDSYAQSGGEQEIVVNNYAELQEAVLEQIIDGTEEATLTTDVYSGDLEEDFERLRAFLTNDDPKYAYLIRAVDGEIARVGSYYKIDLKLEYRHEYAEIQNVDSAVNMDDVQHYLSEALKNNQEKLLLHVLNYVDRNFEQMAKEYARNHLTEVIAEPERVTKETFPGYGSERVLELRFRYPYPLNEEALNSCKTVVEIMIKAAKDRVIDEPDDLEQARLLYASQISGHIYSEESTTTPAFSLFLDRKGDSRAFSAVYQAMCDAAEVRCLTVHGKKDGEPYDWNILDLEAGVWHVDVNADAQSGAPELRLMTDAEMEGYEWDTEAYPACVGRYAPVQTPGNGTAPADGEQSETPQEDQEQPKPDTNPEPPEEKPAEPENNA